jgi:hypothetical protein
MANPRPRPRARDRIFASLGSDAPGSKHASIRLQAIPECEAEALAWGYGIPPDDHLLACRAMWLRLRLRGVPLPAEPRIIVIAGSAP